MVLLVKGIAPTSKFPATIAKGQNCCCKGDKIRSGYITPTFSGAQK